MIKKIILTIIGLGLVGGTTTWVVMYMLERSKQENEDPTPSAQIIRSDISETVVATGIVDALNSTEIRSEINGKIDSINIKNGDMVKKSQILIELDKVTWQSDEEQAGYEYRVQELNLEQAKRDCNRQTELKKAGFAIEQEYENAVTDLKRAEILLNVSKAAWDKAKDNLSKTVIRAPQEGVIINMELNPGQVIIGAGSVSEGTLLMDISDLSRLYVEVSINEVEIEKLTSKTIPKLTFDSLNKVEILGTIEEMSPYAKAQNNVRVFTVKVVFDVGEHNVRPGISVNVEFPIRKVEQVLSAVLSAVFNDTESGYYVYIKNADGLWERRNVEVGLSNIEYVEIISGLNEGDEVALVRPRVNLANADAEKAKLAEKDNKPKKGKK